MDFCQVLGYRVKGFDWDLSQQVRKQELEETLGTFEKFDFFKDYPFWYTKVADIFRQRHPTAKYILCVRQNLKAWVLSKYRHQVLNPLQIPKAGELSALEFWLGLSKQIERYLAQIAYFQLHFNPLFLPLELPNDEKKRQVCEFLECPLPAFDYPHSLNTR